MEKKIIIPENLTDITLGQYQKIVEAQSKDITDDAKVIRIVSVVTGLLSHEVEAMELKDLTEISNKIEIALTNEGSFKPRFKINELELGMIPNFDKITSKEFIDLSTYGDNIETLHNVMAILYRPIKDGGKYYTIDNYTGSKEYADIMKLMPLSYVNGALGFFLTLQKDLLNFTLKSTKVEGQASERHQDTSRSGVGMPRLMTWLRVKFGGMTTS